MRSKNPAKGRRLRRSLIAFCLLASVQFTADAAVKVDFDSSTLNDLLAALTHQEIDVPLTSTKSLTVRLDELRLVGLEPRAGDADRGHLLTSLKLTAPELGISVSVKPRLSLVVSEVEGRSVLELRFEEVMLPLPLGKMNIAGFLPPISLPADSIFLMEGAGGDVKVRSKLSDVRMGLEKLQFEFEIQVVP